VPTEETPSINSFFLYFANRSPPQAYDIFEKGPFIVILSFQPDNCFEYINKHVARLLKKLLIELTKSRTRQSYEVLPHEVLSAQRPDRVQKWLFCQKTH